MLLESSSTAFSRLGFRCHLKRRTSFQNCLVGAQFSSLDFRRGRQRTRSVEWRLSASKLECCVSTKREEVLESNPNGSGCGNGREFEEKAGDAPLLNALRECTEMDTAAFHFPGHRRGAGAPPGMTALIGSRAFASDLPELPELDNLHAVEGVIQEAQCQAARLFGAEQTWFLVNGSTCGIQAAVMAICAPGDYLILPRNVHMSAVSALVLSGAFPKYLNPVVDLAFGVAHGILASQVESAIQEVRRAGNRVGAVLVVSPTYFGVCSDISSFAHVCHSHNVPLLVDEAHGAHFRFHHQLPPTALEQGADVAVQSTHKVLSSLTQSAMLHTQGSRIPRDRLAQCLQMLQSSSPSYLLLASLDASRADMGHNCHFVSETGRFQRSDPFLDAALTLAVKVRQALTKLPGLVILDLPGIDPLRITVGLWGLGLTGFETDDILRMEHGVIAELPSLRSITFAISAGSSHQDAMRLINSFAALSARYANPETAHNLVSSESAAVEKLAEFGWEKSVMALSPRDAFYSESEKVMAGDAVGRVSAELVCPYPPGIPVVTPGEIVTQEAVDCITKVLAEGESSVALQTNPFDLPEWLYHESSKLPGHHFWQSALPADSMRSLNRTSNPGTPSRVYWE